jgi:hypothetical protein
VSDGALPDDDAERWAAMPPPWVVSPGLPTGDWPARQGTLEPYMRLEFAPFWSALAPAERAAYLTYWRAPDEWRAHLAFLDDMAAQATEDDARDSEAVLAQWRAEQAAGAAPRPWWKRLFSL